MSALLSRLLKYVTPTNGEGNMADYLRKVDQFRSIGARIDTKTGFDAESPVNPCFFLKVRHAPGQSRRAQLSHGHLQARLFLKVLGASR